VISGLPHLLRLTRAGFVFAREGVLALIDTRPLPLAAKTAIALGRLIERPSARSGESRLAAALTRLGPTSSATTSRATSRACRTRWRRFRKPRRRRP
jgi:ubiquinone biosynthesis protein